MRVGGPEDTFVLLFYRKLMDCVTGYCSILSIYYLQSREEGRTKEISNGTLRPKEGSIRRDYFWSFIKIVRFPIVLLSHYGSGPELQAMIVYDFGKNFL